MPASLYKRIFESIYRCIIGSCFMAARGSRRRRFDENPFKRGTWQYARPRQAPKLSVSPIRLQLFRGAKFDLQRASRKINGLPAIRIDRNSGWENPFLEGSPTAAVALFRRWLLGDMSLAELAGYSGQGRFLNDAWPITRRRALLKAIPAMRGKNIACWCKPRDPCHGDVLLEIANAPANQI